MAEQLGLDQRVRERGRIDGHERLVTARALPMNGAGDQLLAGAALAGDDDGGGRPRHLRDETVELLHLGVLADQLVEVVLPRQLRAEERHFALQRALLERAPHQREQIVLVEGLGQVVEGAQLHRVDGGADGLDRGDQDHLDAVVHGFDALEHFDAVHLGKADVEKHEVHRAGAEPVERLLAVGGLEQVVLVLQDEPERLADSGIVIHDQDDGPHAVKGVARFGCPESHGPRNVSRAQQSLQGVIVSKPSR